MNPEFGVLTLATKNDYKKAIGLALSLRMANSGIPVSIVCSKKIGDKVGRFFDRVIPEIDNLSGFRHKLFLDHYSPYQNTFFFDSDILIFKDILPIVKQWEGSAYGVTGRYAASGASCFGLNRQLVLSRIGKEKFVDISGAGHAYFEKPACAELFNLAREIMNNYAHYAGSCKFADEDAMGIAMTMMDVPPKENTGFLGMPWHAQKGTIEIDITKRKCAYMDKRYGKREPYILHFPNKGFPFLYAKQLDRLFKMYNAKIRGVWIDAVKQKIATDVRRPMLELRNKYFYKYDILFPNG